VREQDIVVAKNYLTEDEVDTLNRLVVIFLETAELRAKRQTMTSMSFWRENLGQIVVSNGFPLLSGAGSVSHARIEQKLEPRTCTLTSAARARKPHQTMTRHKRTTSNAKDAPWS
jgi:hypothetical protein